MEPRSQRGPLAPDQFERLWKAAERVAATHGLDIFDVQFRRESNGMVLRVMIDRTPDEAGLERPPVAGTPDGVTVEDCQHVSHDLSAVLDVEGDTMGIPDDEYTLEVSSPGLDRPLRHEADYRRFVGRLAKIVTTEPIERQSAFAGRITGLDEGAVLLVEGRRTHRVPLALVKRAHLEVEF
jgi:ribosome maturation factor RimP